MLYVLNIINIIHVKYLNNKEKTSPERLLHRLILVKSSVLLTLREQ